MKTVNLAAMFAMALIALCAQAAENTASGKLTLQKASDMRDDDKIFKVELSTEGLRGECSMYIGKYEEKTAIWAGIKLENAAQEALYYVYNVAFFDIEGRLVCCRQDYRTYMALQVGGQLLVNCWVTVPESEISRIASFKIALYESKTKIGI